MASCTVPFKFLAFLVASLLSSCAVAVAVGSALLRFDGFEADFDVF
jgi:hypothetical protein